MQSYLFLPLSVPLIPTPGFVGGGGGGGGGGLSLSSAIACASCEKAYLVHSRVSCSPLSFSVGALAKGALPQGMSGFLPPSISSIVMIWSRGNATPSGHSVGGVVCFSYRLFAS